MSVFEIIMMICWGVAWPFAIYKSYTSRQNGGKSLLFMIVVVIGYLAGIIHKLLYNYDLVIYLYILNGLMVTADICLFFRNQRWQKRAAALRQKV